MHLPPRTLALVGALACTAALLSATPLTAASPADQPSSKQGSRATRYDGSFVGRLTLDRHDDHGGANQSETSADLKVRGTLADVRVSSELVTGSGKGTLTVTGTGKSSTTTDDGNHVVTCTVSKVSPTSDVMPHLVSVVGSPTFYAFTSLSVVNTCYEDDELLPYQDVTLLPAIPVPVTIKRAEIGRARILLPIDRTMPKAKCPGNVPESTTCTYRLEGTLTLRRPTVMEPFKAPTAPVLKKQKVSITVGCPASCTAALEVRPRTGPGRATTRAELRRGAATVLTVVPRPGLRRAIRKSGGARLEVTYRRGAQTQTFTRTIRS